MRKTHRAGLILFVLAGLGAITSASAADSSSVDPRREGKGKWIENIQITGKVADESKVIQTATASLLVYLPKGYREDEKLPLVIALHGWGQQPAEWRANTDIAHYADQYHLVAAFPDMGKTVYESRFYPQSALKWNKIPGARWIGEVVLPYMRDHYAVTRDRALTAIVGVSTGGRGAVVVAQRYPEFGFCAGLSGTYNLSLPQPSEGEYRIHAIVFGSRDSFPDRWKAEDCINPAYAAALKPVTLYLAHGIDDHVVGEEQLESMRKFLAGFHSNNKVVAVYKAEHGWPFWDSQLGAVFESMAASSRGSRPEHKP